MTARQFDVEITELPPITAQDLRQFDQGAVDMVMEYQHHRWSGWISANQHVILRAPDGDGTASVTRKWRPKRSSEISRRPLDQWLRRKEREREEAERRNAFGLPTAEDSVDVESPEPPWHIATKQSYDALLRMQKRTRDWWEGVRLAGSGMTVWLLHEQGEDNWIVISGSRKDKMTHIAAVGPEAEPEMVQHFKALAEANNRKGIDPMENAGPLTEAKYPCEEPGCDRSFDTQGAVNLHKQVHVKTEIPCPLCPKVVHTPAAFGRHIRSAMHANDSRVAGILEAMRMPPLAVTEAPKRRAERVYSSPPRACDYCGLEMAAKSIGGHHRGHLKVGHIKIVDGGDGATQALPNGAKAITAPKALEAATGAPAKPEPLVVQAVPVVVEPVVVNGTGKHDTPEAVLNMVRTLVNPEMVGENERLRTENMRLTAELETLTERCDNLQAFKDMIREATTA